MVQELFAAAAGGAALPSDRVAAQLVAGEGSPETARLVGRLHRRHDRPLSRSTSIAGSSTDTRRRDESLRAFPATWAIDELGALANCRRVSISSRVAVEPPRDPAHGDLSTNAAMVLAKPARMAPTALAERLTARLERHPDVTRGRVAGPGFLNLRLADSLLARAARRDPARRFRLWRLDAGCRAARSMSNMSRPTRRADPCRATAAAPWSATRWPRSWRRRASPSDARVLHQRCRRPGRCAWRARCICAIARRWARSIGGNTRRPLSRRLSQGDGPRARVARRTEVARPAGIAMAAARCEPSPSRK